MSRTSILAILAGAGVTFLGSATADAIAFARAIQTADETQLVRFAKEFPDSAYKNDALKLADASCIGNWVNAGCTTPSPGSGFVDEQDNRSSARPRYAL